MKGFLYIDNDMIGEIDLKIIDESMGVIGGELASNPLYKKYRAPIQEECMKKGISNEFNYKVVIC